MVPRICLYANRSDSADQFIQQVLGYWKKLANRPDQRALLATVGTGKTEMMLRALAESGPELAEKRVQILVPNNTLSQELLDRMKAILPPEANPRLHRGRLDTVLGAPLCDPSMHAKVELVESFGASAADLVCPTCPFADDVRMESTDRDDGPGVVVMPSTYGTLPAGGRGDVTVVDEDIVLSLYREVEGPHCSLGPSQRPQAAERRAWLAGWQRQANLRCTRYCKARDRSSGTRPMAGSGVTLPALRAAGLTPELAKLAAGIEYGRSEGLKAVLKGELEKGGTPDEIRKRMAAAERDYGDAWKHAEALAVARGATAAPSGRGVKR